MRYLASSCALIFLLMNSMSHAETASGKQNWLSTWESAGQEQGVSAECRQHKSKINQCRFRYTTDVSVEALSSVIMDVDHFTEWAESVSFSKRVFEQEDPSQTYVYTNYNFVGAYDRDAVTLYTPEYHAAEKRMRITFKTVNREVPNTDLRLVRFPLMAGYWQFTELPSGLTEIEHLSFTMPGGAVQKTLYYLYNVAYVDASFVTVRALERQARKSKYQQVAGLTK